VLEAVLNHALRIARRARASGAVRGDVDDLGVLRADRDRPRLHAFGRSVLDRAERRAERAARGSAGLALDDGIEPMAKHELELREAVRGALALSLSKRFDAEGELVELVGIEVRVRLLLEH